MTKQRAGIDWGVPDWSKPGGYPSADALRDEWHWEFRRRHDDYRKDWIAHVQVTIRGPAESPNARIESALAAMPDCLEKWGTSNLVDPRIGWAGLPPILRLIALPHGFHNIELVPDRATRVTTNVVPGRKETARLVQFDVSGPLGPQLKAAEQFLKIEQGKPIEPRAHTDKWPTYLRVIDARSAGAKWREIFDKIVLSDAADDLKEYDRLAGNEQPVQKAKSIWESARQVQFNFFR